LDKAIGGSYATRKDAINKCFKVALKKGMKVFAVQNGGWCAASKSTTGYKKYGKTTGCKNGKGGPERSDVYLVKCGASGLGMTSRYRRLGCWKDVPAKRAVAGLDKAIGGSYATRKDAINKCFKVALKKGMKVFAVQNGGWCAASKSTSGYKKYGKATGCKNGKGGPERSDVYLIYKTSASLRG